MSRRKTQPEQRQEITRKAAAARWGKAKMKRWVTSWKPRCDPAIFQLYPQRPSGYRKLTPCWLVFWASGLFAETKLLQGFLSSRRLRS